MNGAHLHLVLNHIPVILAPTGLVILALKLLRRNLAFVKVGLGVIVAAALFTVPTYFSGEAASDVVGNLPGVHADDIDHHAAMATQALVVIAIAGVLALVALVLGARGKPTYSWLIAAALILSVAASVWLGVTANLGGLIRHPEIRSGAAAER
jgi:uncharacterized membrane protein